jgi:LmbE family N-acetylglucosaminyl deacetylase
MGTKSRETIYGASIRAAAERATEARKAADRLAVEAWNKRMLGFQGPAQPSPTRGDALNAGYGFVEDFLIPIKASFVSLISFPTHPLGLGWEIPVLPRWNHQAALSGGCFSPAWRAGQVMASAPSRKSVAMAVELTRRSNPVITTTAY